MAPERATIPNSAEFFEALFDRSPVPLYVTDRQTLRFLAVNDATVARYGYTREEFADLDVFAIRPPEEADKLRQTLDRDGIIPRRREVWLHQSKSGERFYVEITTHLLHYEGRDAVLVAAADVTERVTAEREVSQQREFLQTMLDKVPVMIMAEAGGGGLLFANREVERVLGWTAEEIRALEARGETLTSFLYPDPEERLRAIEFSRRGTTDWGEFRPRVRDGRTIDMVWATVRLSDGTLVGIGQDVTTRNRLADELRQAQRMESVGRLAGGIAHDFNNLLTALLGYTDIAMKRAGGNPATLETLIEIRKAGERAAALTGRLLAFSRKQVVTPRVLDLGGVVRGLTGMLRRLIGEDIVLETSIEVGTPPVRADKAQMEQMLLNLVVNARDAMPRGGSLRIELRAPDPVPSPGPGPAAHGKTLPGPGRVLLLVRDTGEGMTPEVKAHIFEPFYTTKPLGEGTGLGLATVYGIVRQAGGTIEVESAPGAGSLFRILFPVAEGNVEEEPPPLETIVGDGTETVLLVEDDTAVRELTVEMLQLGGYKVVAAATGRDAILLLERGVHVDLVVSDLVMPGLNGWQVRELVGQTHPELPFIFMSGYAADDIARRGIQTEGAAFLAKPFRNEDLLHRVRSLLDRSQAARP